MAALGQTIAVIDKSGKVVSTSKHIFGVFKEAKAAYKDKKAEIHAGRQAKHSEREARRAMAAFTLQDGRSVTSSRRGPSRSKSVARHGDRRSTVSRALPQEFEQDLHYSHPDHPPRQEIARRHTSHDVGVAGPVFPKHRSHSTPHMDMDLAYGEFHPSSLERLHHEREEEGDVNGLVTKASRLLEEAQCAQHSAQATIAHLQKHPDAMAAVALTLAEISKVVSKLAPAALASLKASSPAVFALLASPQFMIAAGVGVGVTIVLFGGYKIVKRITEANTAKAQGAELMDEMLELELSQSVSHVEMWRRGVADMEAVSVGTSVHGEFITPTAAAMSGMLVPGRVDELRGSGSRRSARGGETVVDDRSEYSRGTRTSRSSRSSRRSKASTEVSGKEKNKKKKDKTKKPSPLRLLFHR
ncbi:hypothetical protein AJ80_09330 [Polytolypa hystricis UAMH7299]|uniref:Uncharacterized protein n=1 Tax=Polytolypa hystricis (strain UAMH7299) TaxID=1447883 RepID=A0A2B7WJL6_POLH7|nr:hypothetical protein AJ80_09330 [Polytolypa hystricis UAMH7299]